MVKHVACGGAKRYQVTYFIHEPTRDRRGKTILPPAFGDVYFGGASGSEAGFLSTISALSDEQLCKAEFSMSRELRVPRVGIRVKYDPHSLPGNFVVLHVAARGASLAREILAKAGDTLRIGDDGLSAVFSNEPGPVRSARAALDRIRANEPVGELKNLGC